MEISGIFADSVMSCDICWGRQVKGCLDKSKHVKECFPEVETGERMFWYIKHVKGPMMKEYIYDPTGSGQQALSFGLVCSTSLFFNKDTHVLVRLTWWCWVQLVVMSPLREARPRTAPEVPATDCSSCGLALGWLVILVVSSGLNYSCLVSA